MTPSSILLIRPDTLGDLVLFTSGLSILREHLPDTRIRVLVRSAYRSITPLLNPEVEWLTTPINPFAQSPGEAWGEVDALVTSLRETPPDLIIVPCRRLTWLESALIASFPGATSLSLATNEEDAFHGTELLLKLGLDKAPRPTHEVRLPDEIPDWKAGYFIAEYLGLKPGSMPRPELRIPKDQLERGRELLSRLGLEPGRFAICAPAGFANVAIKTWPAEHFAQTAHWLWETHTLPTLFVGSKGELNYLMGVKKEVGEDSGAHVWTGDADELPMLATLTAQARIYYGNDTGAMHLAAASGIPVAAIFGGGTWPRFVPASPTFAALVNPLPCFGCGWECCFNDAPCIKAIPCSDLTEALDKLLAGHPPGEVKLMRISEDGVSLAGKASSLLRFRTGQLKEREATLQSTAVLAAVKDAEIQRLKDTCENQERVLLEKEKEIFEKEAEIKSLKQACEDRLALIYKYSAEVGEVHKLCAKYDQEAHQSRAAADEAKSRLVELETRFNALPQEAAGMIHLLEEARQQKASLGDQLALAEKTIKTLRASLAERDASLANLTANLGVLELHRHYQRQLRAKEDVIQSLHNSCVEREHLIRRLSLGEGSALNRLIDGTSGWWEARVAAPLRKRWAAWLIKGHWMQLGELHQHEPRPLAWDPSLSRCKPGSGKLPKIGIVTPSYNQAVFLGSTMRSVLSQKYPQLLYVVQDGGSKDASPRLIAEQAEHLHAWESTKDKGQADAIIKGFGKLADSLDPEDVMAWLNSDDMLAPGALAFVGRYFAAHPEVDVIYGHRIIIDAHDREIGRWILPAHEQESLRWTDLIPQETLFWRKRAWDQVGGLDPSFHFALDWDFLLRLQEAELKIVRVPQFIGAFRVHEESKTQSLLHKKGREEMDLLLGRVHGAGMDHTGIDKAVSRLKSRGALCSRLLALGVRW